MHIKINIPEGTDNDDKKIIELLELHPDFQKSLNYTRKMFGIPPNGLDEESFYFKNNFLTDKSGKKVKIIKSFPEDGTDESFRSFDKFLNDPDSFLSKERKFRKQIEKIAKQFNLGKNWYHALCHIVLFSTAEWLPLPIQSTVRNLRIKSVWHPTSIVLEITKNISKKQFTKWLDKNWDELRGRLDTDLQITKENGIFKDKLFELTKEIIKLRNKNMSFDAISDKLAKKYQDKYGPETDESKLIVSAKAIQDRYYRFLRLFNSNFQKR